MNKIPKIYRIAVFFMGFPLYCFLRIIWFPNVFIRKKLRENYIHNLEKSKALQFPLCGQRLGELSEIRIGLKKAAHCGCGAIAVYNAMSMIGKEPQLHDIVAAIEKRGLLFYGMFGTNPVAIGKYLTRQGIVWKRYKNAAQVEQEYEDGDAVICLYNWASKSGLGAHYVALGRENGVWKGYNVYSRSDKIYEYKSLQAFIDADEYARPVTWFLVKKG